VGPARPGSGQRSVATASTRRPTAARTGSAWTGGDGADRRHRHRPKTPTPSRLRHPDMPSISHPTAASTDARRGRLGQGSVRRQRHRVRRPGDRPQDGHICTPACAVPAPAWTFSSGGRGSGLYKSSGGGATWKKSQDGCRRPIWAASRWRWRVARAASLRHRRGEGPERPVTAPTTPASPGRSAHGARRHGRPFYSRACTSTRGIRPSLQDGFRGKHQRGRGATFSRLGGTYHGDTHAFWIDPRQTDQVILGTGRRGLLSMDSRLPLADDGDLPVGQYTTSPTTWNGRYNVTAGCRQRLVVRPSRGSGGIPGRGGTRACSATASGRSPIRRTTTLVRGVQEAGCSACASRRSR